ncbi:MAG: plastocyanin/azurin family copper-binding protein [Bacteroidota bacterium]
MKYLPISLLFLLSALMACQSGGEQTASKPRVIKEKTDRPTTQEDNATDEQAEQAPATQEVLDKYVTEMPSSWNGKADQSLEIGTKPGMKYDKELLIVQAGARVQLTMNNTDAMMHNLAITLPGQADKVGEAAMKMGLDGAAKNYIPDDMPEILCHTKMIQPQESETIYFVAPSKPGRYQYVCTFPGHHIIMRGDLVVRKG